MMTTDLPPGEFADSGESTFYVEFQHISVSHGSRVKHYQLPVSGFEVGSEDLSSKLSSLDEA